MRRRPATRIAGILMGRIIVLLDRQPSAKRPATDVYLLTFDGGARRRGPSGGGWTLSRDGVLVACGWASYAPGSTNNYAEASGLLDGLRYKNAIDPSNERAIHIRGDSTLILKQLAGHWAVRQPQLRRLIHDIRQELASTYFTLRHVRRAWNKAADWLANYAMDRTETRTLAWDPTRPRRELLHVCSLLRQDRDPTSTYVDIRTPLVRATQLTVKRLYEQKRVDSA